MTWVRLAVDLGSDEIGPFAYAKAARELPRLPVRDEQVPIDEARTHMLRVVTTTVGFDDDDDIPIVWGRPTVEAPVSQDELWELGFWGGRFRPFNVDGKKMSAEEIVAYADRREQLRHARKAVVSVVLAAATIAGGVAGAVEAEHVIVMAGHELYELLEALRR
jgi:hypothetical protein